MCRLCIFCLCLVVVGNLGCAPPPRGPAPSAKVKGTVNMDGKPLRSGEIHCGIVGYPPQILPINDGAFSGEAPIGKNQVEVHVYVDGPPSPKNPGVPTKINTAPQRYWGNKSVLDANVTADGLNEFKFDLTSAK